MHKSARIGNKKGTSVVGAGPRRCRRAEGNGAITGWRAQNSRSQCAIEVYRNLLVTKSVGETPGVWG